MSSLQERVESLAHDWAGPSSAVSVDKLTAGWSVTVWGAKGETLAVVRGHETRDAALRAMRSKLLVSLAEREEEAGS